MNMGPWAEMRSLFLSSRKSDMIEILEMSAAAGF